MKRQPPPPYPFHHTRSAREGLALSRRGLTLVELLVVISILVVVISISIPLIRPAFKNRKVREASRQITSMIARAKARAVELNRNVGIWIERRDNTELGSRQGVRIYLCEEPPPFAGTTESSLVSVDTSNVPVVAPELQPGIINFARFLDFSQVVDSELMKTLISPGELFSIQFDRRGAFHTGRRLVSPPPGTPVPGYTDFSFVVFFFESGVPTDVRIPPQALQPSRFTVRRGPRRTSDQPVAMPGDSVIDLSVSGFGALGRQMDPTFDMINNVWNESPAIFTFSPNGNMQNVFLGFLNFEPHDALHLMVGKNVNTVNPNVANWFQNPNNLSDLSSIWISVGHRTGTIVTSKNENVTQFSANLRLEQSRFGARRAIGTGGR